MISSNRFDVYMTMLQRNTNIDTYYIQFDDMRKSILSTKLYYKQLIVFE